MKPVRKNIYLGIMYLASYVILTSASSIFVNKLERTISPVVVSSIAFLLSFFFLVLINILHLKELIKKFSEHKTTCMLNNIATLVLWLSVFFGLKFSKPVFFISVFFGCIPLATTFFKISKHFFIHILFSLIVITSLILLEKHSSIFVNISGLTIFSLSLAILGGTSAAYSNILSNSMYHIGLRTSQVLLIRICFVTLVCLILSVFSSGNLINWNFNQNIKLLSIAVFYVILPLLCLQKSIEKTPIFTVALSIPLVPVTTFFINLLITNTLIISQFYFELALFFILLTLNILTIWFNEKEFKNYQVN